MKVYGVAYNTTDGDAHLGFVKADEESLNKLKEHKCVASLIDVVTGEIVLDENADATFFLARDLKSDMEEVKVEHILEQIWLSDEQLFI